VGAHVQACFAVEEAVAAAIGAGTITTIADIDAANWPG
jgi:Mn2+/Fe2+ NRAMP family transporter